MRLFSKIAFVVCCLLFNVNCLLGNASPSQRPRYDKLSPMLRQMVRQQQSPSASRMTVRQAAVSLKASSVCAFVKVTDGGEDALRAHGCRVLTQVDDICIVDIPKEKIGPLTLDNRILRIEANRSTRAQTDLVSTQLNAAAVYAGQGLPQAYTGRGVVVGVMDIGFDLTHPNFYSSDTTEYRIQRFWDMLSADTVGSQFYVGRDYAGREELLAVAHARDGLDQTHGTHTTGIAAGSGYDSPYRGLAPESDICLVANAVSDDIAYIDSADYDKYTFATDALGFKYIFDYAESQGKPCVINFSEGSGQDFWGYDVLYYEMLERLTGPGRIIVSAAGNNGNDKTWFRKQYGQASAGTFLKTYQHTAMITLKSADDFILRIVAYKGNVNDTLTIDTRQVLMQQDSVLNAMLRMPDDSVGVLSEAYPSCYDERETCYDITFTGTHNIGTTPKLSFEVVGVEADVEAYRVSGDFVEDSTNPSLNAGDLSRSILSPASAPCVVCVGATAYRPSFVNYKGEQYVNNHGTDGRRSRNSAIGPTYDGRTKPNVMAPGINIISSYSSYYIETHPNARDINSDVEHFDFAGRTYAWNCNSGTSMSAPAVAGIIALWLEACPTLSPEDIMGVLERTCRHYDPALDYPNNLYGYGEIDAYRGLQDILRVNSIDGVSPYPTKAHVTIHDGVLEVSIPSVSIVPTTVSVYTLSGRSLVRHRIPADCTSCHLPLPTLRQGDICIVQIDGDASFSGSMIVRR